MNQQQQEQMSSGLTRYKSAPSSYFASLFTSDDGPGGDDLDNIFNHRASSPETNRVFSSFMESVNTIYQNYSSNMNIQTQSQPQFVQSVKHVTIDQQLQRHSSNDFSLVSHMIYQRQPQQGYNSEAATSAMDYSYSRSLSLINSDRVNQMKFNGGGTNLIRHSSSPAGFFANRNIENEFDAVRDVGNFRAGISTKAEAPMFTFKSPMSFLSGHPSSSEMMTIDEMGCKMSPGKGNLEEDGNKNGGYITSFPAPLRMMTIRCSPVSQIIRIVTIKSIVQFLCLITELCRRILHYYPKFYHKIQHSANLEQNVVLLLIPGAFLKG
ncbi:Hypothetical predicted protein [Olea europaea subsp. europaea]|uniref:Uncharacterized protein n=1 Tax=Olea europaea subsp. europaea TaxID=158383 RepID=A0A8S0PAT8_OLEEU|nr:Hypothetical predicted protein [Olea europaea subsp. europaea]